MEVPLYIYRKIAARCTTRLARSRSPIIGQPQFPTIVVYGVTGKFES